MMNCIMQLMLMLCLLLAAANLSAAQLDINEADSEGEGGGAVDADSAARKLKVGDRYSKMPETVRRKRLSVPYSPGKSLKLRCTPGPGLAFAGWIRKKRVISSDEQTIVPLDNRSYGLYYCIARIEANPSKNVTMEFLITEMPNENDNVSVTPVPLNAKASLICSLNSTSGYEWFKYNDYNYRFVSMSNTDKNLVINYEDLVRDTEAGFTFYKCQAKGSNAMQFFRLKKEFLGDTVAGTSGKRYELTMKPVQSGVAAMPVAVAPQSRVSFECHKVTATNNATWSFRSNSTVNPQDYANPNGSIEVKEESDMSVLSVNNCGVKNVGYYRCVIGGVVKYAFLNMEVIVPTIHEFSKGVYDMNKFPGNTNELECEIPLGGEVKDVVWRVVPPSGSPPAFDIGVNQKVKGFETVVKKSDKSRLVVIKFNDSAAANAYRLECRLGDELDFVTLKSTPKAIRIYYEKYHIKDVKLVMCDHGQLTNITYHINGINSTPIARGEAFHNPINATFKAYYHSPSQPQHYYRCSGVNSAGKRIYSNVLALYDIPLKLTLSVDGTVLDPNNPIAKTAGSPSKFLCRMLKSTEIEIDPKNIVLERNGIRRNDLIKTVVNGTDPTVTDFIFNLTSPTSGDSGVYQCKHATNINMKKAKSSSGAVNWCNTDQFMCDGGCKNSSVKCNGVADCKDGTDEVFTTCNICKPTEIPCGIFKNKNPDRKCTLKHWLCDGQNDCGNNFDELSEIAKGYCTKTCQNPSLNCPLNSTCCANSSKCILRSYECDEESDCSTGSDESRCCQLDVNKPTSSFTMTRSEGSNVTITCEATGKERPTISWRCNWGHLRDPKRMKESNEVVKVDGLGLYTVIGKLVITNFTKTDECLYNCEAITKCKRTLSPEVNLKVGSDPECNNSTCGSGGKCIRGVCECKKNVGGDKCDKCKDGFHSLMPNHPDGCVPCFCSGRYFQCQTAGLYFNQKKLSIEENQIRLSGWGLHGNYESRNSKLKMSVTGNGEAAEIQVASPADAASVVSDDDKSYVLFTGLAGKRFTSYGGKLSFKIKVELRSGAAAAARDTRFPLFGIKGWRGQALYYWLPSSDTDLEKTFSVPLDERNLKTLDGKSVTRADVMTVLGDMWAAVFRANHFASQKSAAISSISIEEATASSGSAPAQVEKCSSCVKPYAGDFCEECSSSMAGKDYHKIIAYNNTMARWKCVPCKAGFTNSPGCNQCEEGYADTKLNRPSGEQKNCEIYAVPMVEPETLRVRRGRTAVLTCSVKNRNSYNGTVWVLQWQRDGGSKIKNSQKIFQTRSETSTRLVIKDISAADAGRYRCEAINRRSGSAFAFTNITVVSSRIKFVNMRMSPAGYDKTLIECDVAALESGNLPNYRMLLTFEPFPVENTPTDFEKLMASTDSGKLSTKVSYLMSNYNHSGFWYCHVSDFSNNYTVSKRIPVILQTKSVYLWDVKADPEKIEPKVGDSVRLKCRRIIRSPRDVTFSIKWSFKLRTEGPRFLGFSMGGKLQNNYHVMNETDSDQLPPGAFRDGDDLILNPVSSEHWGTFTCSGSRIGKTSKRTKRSEFYYSDISIKTAQIIVNPQFAVQQFININKGDGLQLSCFNSSRTTDSDGLPCAKFSWWYQSDNSAKQLVGKASLKVLHLLGEDGPLTKAKTLKTGIYFCRCHTFYRSGSDLEFSKLSQFNVFKSVPEDKPPSIIKKLRIKRFVPGRVQWLYCNDNGSVPAAKLWWQFNGKPIDTVPGLTIVGTGPGGLRFSNISFVMDPALHQGLFRCTAESSVGTAKEFFNLFYSTVKPYKPLVLKFIIMDNYGLVVRNQSHDNSYLDHLYVPRGYTDDGMDYFEDQLEFSCVAVGSPLPSQNPKIINSPVWIQHDNPMPSADVPLRFGACTSERRLMYPNIDYCGKKTYSDYRYLRWKCSAEQKTINGTSVVFRKFLNTHIVKSRIRLNITYYNKTYVYSRYPPTLNFIQGATAVIYIDGDYKADNGSFVPIPSNFEYLFFIGLEKGLPSFAKQNGGILTISNVPMSLNGKKMNIYSAPKNRQDIIKYGVGQKQFFLRVNPIPKPPKISISIDDGNQTIHNPEYVILRKGYRRRKLVCEMDNFVEGERGPNRKHLVNWFYCADCHCELNRLYEGQSIGALNGMYRYVSSSGNSSWLVLPPSNIKKTGCYLCIANRPYYNASGLEDYVMAIQKLMFVWESVPAIEGKWNIIYDPSKKFTIKQRKNFDIEFTCFCTGFPFPKMEIVKVYDNGTTAPLAPNILKEFDGRYYSKEYNYIYGSQLTYIIPKGRVIENNYGNYTCTGTNKFGVATVNASFTSPMGL